MMSEITVHKLTEFELAQATLQRLEGKKNQLMYELEEVQRQTVDAAAKVEKTRFAAQKSGAMPDPPIPRLETLIELAKASCPHRSPHELAQMAARLHGAAVGTSRIGVNVENPLSPIEGEGVRDVNDHDYNVPPPDGPGSPMSPKPDLPAGAKFVKTYI